MRTENKLKIRENKIIRAIYSPYKNFVIQMEKRSFLSSNYPNKLKDFHNRYVGKRCFIIGNGPSLTVDDLEKLKDEITFAANRIYRLYNQTSWRPTFWLCVDPYILEEDHELINQLDGLKFVSFKARKWQFKNSESLFFIYNYQPYRINKYSSRIDIKFSNNPSEYLVAGETVTYNSIQLAVYMGFTEIYLLGVDHSYSKTVDSKGKLHIDKSIKDYFGNIKSESFNIQNYIVSTAAYKSAFKYCSEKGIRIFNATRGGKLEELPRTNFDGLFNSSDEKNVQNEY